MVINFSLRLLLLFSAFSSVNAGDLTNEALSIVNQNYVKSVDSETVEEGAVRGMISSLDPHSSYISKDQFQKVKEIISGSYSGIGVEISIANEYPIVLEIISNSPAARAGLKKGDILLEANGSKLYNLKIDKAKEVLTGKIGSVVEILVFRGNEELKFKIRRDKISVAQVTTKLLDNGEICYIKIRSFSQGISKKIKDHYDKLDKKNLKGIVIDLRFNPGGLLDESINVSNLFLKKNSKIVSIRSRKDNQVFVCNSEDITNNLPIVVMINSMSASAAEIVASALQDNKRALLVGMQSFGKGSVQTTFSLSNGGAIKLTTALYYTPNGNVIQNNGVRPDVVAEDAAIISKIDFPEISEKKLDKSLSGDLFQKQDKQDKSVQKFQLFSKKIIGNETQDFQLMRAIDVLKTMQFYWDTPSS
jgi:carboxyl-terminal processing protease